VRLQITEYCGVEIGYHTRGQTYIAISGSPSTYWQAGGYDTRRRIFTTPARYNIGVQAHVANGSEVFDKFGGVSTTLHEAYPGHGLQVPLSQEIDCSVSVFSSAPTAFVEGWALYVEQFGYTFGKSAQSPKGMYTDPFQELGTLNNDMMRANRLQEDTGLHFMGWDYDQAWQTMQSNGFPAEYAQTETFRYISMPGQATGYMIGRLKLNDIRTYVQSALTARGMVFDPREFNMVMTKFGGASLSDLDQLAHTYVAVQTSNSFDSSLSSLFGYDLITKYLFAASLPVVGYGT